MANPSDVSAPSEFSFTRALVGTGRLNNSSSTFNSNATAVGSFVKRESFLQDDFATPLLPTASALSSHSTSHLPKRAFPLLGGWGRASAAPLPPVAPAAPTEIIVGGVTLSFPFPPYPSQVCLSNQMIRAFKLRKHALLESPTGTGEYFLIPQLEFICVVFNSLVCMYVVFNSLVFPQANRLLFCAQALLGSSLKRRASKKLTTDAGKPMLPRPPSYRKLPPCQHRLQRPLPTHKN